MDAEYIRLFLGVHRRIPPCGSTTRIIYLGVYTGAQGNIHNHIYKGQPKIHQISDRPQVHKSKARPEGSDVRPASAYGGVAPKNGHSLGWLRIRLVLGVRLNQTPKCKQCYLTVTISEVAKGFSGWVMRSHV